MLAAALLWLACVATGRVGAQAPPYRLIVLQLESENVDDALAHKLTERLQDQLRQRAGFALVDTSVSLAQLSLALNCDSSQLACLELVAQQLHVDGLLFGNLSRDGDAEQAHLQHFDSADKALKGSALVTLAPDLDDAAFDRQARELVDVLFEAPPTRLAPADVSPQRAALAQPTQVPAQAPIEPDDSRKVAGYALLGGAVLSAGLSVLSFVEIDHSQNNDAFERYRRAVGQQRPSVRDVCDEALGQQSYGLDAGSISRVRSSCATGRTFEVLQFLFIGGAVISGGLSAFLLLGPGSEQPARTQTDHASRFSLHPSLSRRGASLKARFTF
jgi:hypothetical protein